MRLTKSACLIWVVCTACGGSHDSSSVSVDTGLEPVQSLAGLDDAGVQALCHAYYRALDTSIGDAELVRAQCVYVAIQNAALSDDASADRANTAFDVEACQQTSENCLQNPVDFGVATTYAAAAADCDSFSHDDAALQTCTADVAEYERCTSASIEAQRMAWRAIRCERGAELLGSELGAPAVAACDAFTNKCPDWQIR